MKPTYYQAEDKSNMQLFDVLEAEHLDYNFCVSNAVKYLFRYNKKGEAITDLQKGIVYLEREKAKDRKIFRSVLKFLFFWVATKKVKIETIKAIFGLNTFQVSTFELILEQKYELAIQAFLLEIRRLESKKTTL